MVEEGEDNSRMEKGDYWRMAERTQVEHTEGVMVNMETRVD